MRIRKDISTLIFLVFIFSLFVNIGEAYSGTLRFYMGRGASTARAYDSDGTTVLPGADQGAGDDPANFPLVQIYKQVGTKDGYTIADDVLEQSLGMGYGTGFGTHEGCFQAENFASVTDNYYYVRIFNAKTVGESTYYTDTTAHQSDGTTGEEVDLDSASTTVAIPGAVTTMTVSGTTTITAGSPGTLTVQVLDGQPQPVTTGVYTLTLTSNSAGTYTFTDAAGNTITELVIAEGESYTAFTYADTLVGTPTITLTSKPGNPYTPAVETQGMTINVGDAYRVAITSGVLTQMAGQYGQMTITVQDQYGNTVTSHGGLTVTMSSDSGGAPAFYELDETTLITGGIITIADGTGTATFKYYDTVAGTPTITATTTLTDTSESQAGQTINPATADKLVIGLNAGTTGYTQTAGSIANVYTVQVQDTFNSAVTAGAFVVNLSSTAGAGNYTFYNASQQPVTQLSIPEGQSYTAFVYYDTTVGTPTIQMAYGSGPYSLTLATQQLTVSPAAAYTINHTSGGTGESYTVGTASAALTVTLHDQYGNLVADGTAVSYTVGSGGGSLSTESAATTTGVASATLTLGTTVGSNTAAAWSGSLTPVTFTVVGIADAANSLTIVSGNAGSYTVNTISDPLVVQVKDQYGNVVAGTAVTFASSDGTITNYTTTTDASGLASAGLTLNTTMGSNTATATATGLTGSPISFTATGVADAATKVTLSTDRSIVASQGNGSATLTAEVQDQYGNLVDDDTTEITFTIAPSNYARFTATSSSTYTATVTDGTVDAIVVSYSGTAGTNGQTETVSSQDTATLLAAATPVALTIVDFSATASGTTNLIASSTVNPFSVTLTGTGRESSGNDYEWTLVPGDATDKGSISAGTGTTITYTAPSSLGSLTSTTDQVVLTATGDTDLVYTTTINVYNQVAITAPSTAIGLAVADTYNLSITGGTESYNYASSDSNGLTVTSGVLTAVTAGTYSITVWDATYGVQGTDNGFRAVTSYDIQVVNPLVVTPATANMEAGASQAYSSTNGTTSGLATWAVTPISAGTLYKADCSTAISSSTTYTEVCYKASSTVSTDTAYTITATDGTYSNVSDQAGGTIYANLSLTTPTGYAAGTASTWPLMTTVTGSVYTATVAGGSGSYNWTVKDAGGTTRLSQLAGDGTYAIDIDTLFNASGAGVYTVIAEDALYSFTASTMYIRVPLRITPLTGSYQDIGVDQTFTIDEGGGAASAYTWTVTNETGTEITSTFGSFSGTSNAEAFDFTTVSEVTYFRAQAQSNDLSLAAAGLDTVITNTQVIVPVQTFNISVVSTDEPNGVEFAVILADHDPLAYSATTNATGAATIAGLQNTGATYNFSVVPPTNVFDYLPIKFSVTDLSATKTVTVNAAAGTLTTITGNVGGVGSGSIKLQLMQDDGSYVKDSAGNTIEALAVANGDYTVAYDTANAAGPYTVVAFRSGAATSVTDNLGTVSATDGDTGRNITLVATTKITIVNDNQTPNVSFTITATPAFNGSADEIWVNEGTSKAATKVALGGNGTTTYTYTTTLTSGSSTSIYVQGDSTSARTSETGYYATATNTAIAVAVTTNTTAIGNPVMLSSTQTATSASLETTVDIPAGGIVGEIIPSITVAVSEANALSAGATLVTASDLVEVTISDTNTGDELSNTAIIKIYITLTFDTSKVASGSLEAGTMAILHAVDMAAMVAGTATGMPTSQIVSTDYANGKVTFWTDSLSVFGIGAGGGGGSGLLGAGGSGCFVATAADDAGQNGLAWLLLSLAGAAIILGLLARTTKKTN